MANLITFDKPADWKRIKPDHYADFSIVNNEYTPCEYGYAVANEQKSYDVVSIFNYGPVGAEFLTELKAQLDSFSEDNKKECKEKAIEIYTKAIELGSVEAMLSMYHIELNEGVQSCPSFPFLDEPIRPEQKDAEKEHFAKGGFA